MSCAGRFYVGEWTKLHKKLKRRLKPGKLMESNCASNANMRGLAGGCALVLAIFALSIVSNAGTPGSFRGTIVDGPHSGAGKKWVYVQGRNGMARRVEVSRAHVTYDDAVPADTRLPRAEDALIAGTEVRVTAEQGNDGEWTATRVEILKAARKASDQRQGWHTS